jgi:hypothetical protein
MFSLKEETTNVSVPQQTQTKFLIGSVSTHANQLLKLTVRYSLVSSRVQRSDSMKSHYYCKPVFSPENH